MRRERQPEDACRPLQRRGQRSPRQSARADTPPPGAGSGRERRTVHAARMTAQRRQTFARRRERRLARGRELDRVHHHPAALVLGIELLGCMMARLLYDLVEQRRHLFGAAGQLFQAAAPGRRNVGRSVHGGAHAVTHWRVGARRRRQQQHTERETAARELQQTRAAEQSARSGGGPGRSLPWCFAPHARGSIPADSALNQVSTAPTTESSVGTAAGI
jgi:hypothetical protein